MNKVNTAEQINDFFKESLSTFKTLSEGMVDIMVNYIKERGSDYYCMKIISFDKEIFVKDENENTIKVSGLEVLNNYDELYLNCNGERKRAAIGDLESLLLIFNAFRKAVIAKEKKAA